MADEPSNGELARRLDAITSRTDEIVRLLQGLVSRVEYNEYQRHVEQRFARVELDIADKRRNHDDDMRELREEVKAATARVDRDLDALRAKVDDDGKTGTGNFRQAIYMGLIPGIILVVTLLVTALLTLKGGK